MYECVNFIAIKKIYNRIVHQWIDERKSACTHFYWIVFVSVFVFVSTTYSIILCLSFCILSTPVDDVVRFAFASQAIREKEEAKFHIQKHITWSKRFHCKQCVNVFFCKVKRQPNWKRIKKIEWDTQIKKNTYKMSFLFEREKMKRVVLVFFTCVCEQFFSSLVHDYLCSCCCCCCWTNRNQRGKTIYYKFLTKSDKHFLSLVPLLEFGCLLFFIYFLCLIFGWLL